MRSLIIGFIVFLLFATVCRWHYVCNIKDHCGKRAAQIDPDKLQLTHENGDVILYNYDHFKFGKDSVNADANPNNDDFLKAVAAQLEENPGWNLKITGQLLDGEAGKSHDIWENLGQARANIIRERLVAMGIDKNRLKIDFKQMPKEVTSLDKPISFTLTGDKELAEMANNNGEDDPDENGKETDDEGNPDDYGDDSDISFENMTYSDANFELNSAVFKPGTAFQNYAQQVKEYLEKEENKGKQLLIVGHTCDRGKDSHNMTLGMERAKAARKYFKDLGVSADIGVKSDGETNPLKDYPNTSEENRSRNRRVNIQIR